MPLLGVSARLFCDGVKRQESRARLARPPAAGSRVSGVFSRNLTRATHGARFPKVWPLRLWPRGYFRGFRGTRAVRGNRPVPNALGCTHSARSKETTTTTTTMRVPTLRAAMGIRRLSAARVREVHSPRTALRGVVHVCAIKKQCLSNEHIHVRKARIERETRPPVSILVISVEIESRPRARANKALCLANGVRLEVESRVQGKCKPKGIRPSVCPDSVVSRDRKKSQLPPRTVCFRRLTASRRAGHCFYP